MWQWWKYEGLDKKKEFVLLSTSNNFSNITLSSALTMIPSNDGFFHGEPPIEVSLLLLQMCKMQILSCLPLILLIKKWVIISVAITFKSCILLSSLKKQELWAIWKKTSELD